MVNIEGYCAVGHGFVAGFGLSVRGCLDVISLAVHMVLWTKDCEPKWFQLISDAAQEPVAGSEASNKDNMLSGRQ